MNTGEASHEMQMRACVLAISKRQAKTPEDCRTTFVVLIFLLQIHELLSKSLARQDQYISAVR
jgi:hypothetical protein